nr:MAG TPA: hypothetical protein [Caudoviricetes sp.]
MSRHNQVVPVGARFLYRTRHDEKRAGAGFRYVHRTAGTQPYETDVPFHPQVFLIHTHTGDNTRYGDGLQNERSPLRYNINVVGSQINNFHFSSCFSCGKYVNFSLQKIAYFWCGKILYFYLGKIGDFLPQKCMNFRWEKSGIFICGQWTRPAGQTGQKPLSSSLLLCPSLSVSKWTDGTKNSSIKSIGYNGSVQPCRGLAIKTDTYADRWTELQKTHLYII